MLEGDISQINLIERLVELWREQFTGAIRFENDGIIKIIYFKSGDILSASTNDRSDSIDEILMKAGKVSREHVKQALAKRKENETLGDALLNLGFITRKELTWARRVQVVGVIRSIAGWTDGSFTIVADYLPKRDEGTLFPLPQVLVELIVTEADRGRFEKALDGGNAVFAKNPDFDDVWRRLGLNEDADAIANEIDGDKSATEIATTSGRDTFNVYKLLHALATLGVLKRVQKAAAEPQFSLDDFASAGVADAADLWNQPEPAIPVSAPDFQLDATEEVELPALSIEPETVPNQITYDPSTAQTQVTSAWDEPDELPLAYEPVTEEPEPEPEPAATMPAWDAPSATPRRDALATPVQTDVEPPAEADEEQWGFDEAQIETARRAAEPPATTTAPPPIPMPAAPFRTPGVPKARRKEGGRYGLLVALLVIAIIGAAGWFGFQWWQGRQEAATEPVVVERRPPLRPAPVPAPTADTAATTPAPATATTATTTVAETTTTAPQVPASTTVTPVVPTPAPIQITAGAPVAPAASTTAPLPAVRPRTSSSPAGRERYDAMAREYAANATGNFTVQIQILCSHTNLENAMRAGGSQVWFVPQTLGDRSCYRVFYGRYNTREEAQQALATVPAAIRDRSAAVKPVPR